MKRTLILNVFLCAALSACAVAAAMALGAQPAQNSNQTQKEKPKPAERDDDDDDDDDEEDAEEQARLAKLAKVSPERAREIALERVPGTVEEMELEREKGKLVYSFDIRDAQGTVMEVLVDANDGSVVSVEKDDEDDDDDDDDDKKKPKEEARKPGKRP